jgi:protein-L-isoaspartate(D-aspartate) O-methyltransferase
MSAGPALASRAYEDTALPLGMGQTISQPFVVARMIELLLNGRTSLGKTLEVGAGCGYQAAVLGTLSKEVLLSSGWRRCARARDNLRTAKLPHVRLATPTHGGTAGSRALRYHRRRCRGGRRRAHCRSTGAGRPPDAALGSQDQVLNLFGDHRTGRGGNAPDPVRFVPLLPGVD